MARKATIWRCVVQDDNADGAVLFWARTRRDVLAAARAYAESGGANPDPDPEMEARLPISEPYKVTIELSTDGLVRWLNDNFTTDNG